MNLLHDLIAIAWKQTIKEPVLREASRDPPPLAGLVADISARGVWQPQSVSVFDIRVLDSDAPSYLSRTLEDVLLMAEREKNGNIMVSVKKDIQALPFSVVPSMCYLGVR